MDKKESNTEGQVTDSSGQFEYRGPEHRTSSRFPMDEELHYKIYGDGDAVFSGVGRTVNMSSKGVLFEAQEPMGAGRRIDLAVNWPAQLDNQCPLKLVASGRIVRSEPDKVAVKIDRYEFRTRGSRLKSR